MRGSYSGIENAKQALDESLDEKPFLQLASARKPRRVFLQSMGDITHDEVSFDLIDRILGWVALLKQHTFMLLTKRPERLLEYMVHRATEEEVWGARDHILDKGVPTKFYENLKYWEQRDEHDVGVFVRTAFAWEPGPVWPLPNLWIGVTAENQLRADERIPILLQIPATVHFISYEPALGPLCVKPYLVPQHIKEGYQEVLKRFPATGPIPRHLQPRTGLDLIVAGGETGPGARPAHPDWFRQVRDQCKEAGVPFFFKSWGAHVPAVGRDETGDIYFPPAEHDTRVDPFGDGTYMLRVNREIKHLTR